MLRIAAAANPQKQDKNLAQQIFKSFNTWKFKREQPHTEDKFIQTISTRILNNESIKFVAYWGKGKRNKVSIPEKTGLEYLQSLFERIKNIYPKGVECSLIFTDTHAELNGHDPKNIKSYYQSLKKLAQAQNIKVILMSSLVSFHKNQLPTGSPPKNLLKTLKKSSEKHYKGNQSNIEVAKVYYLQNQLEKEQVAKKFSDHIFLTYNSSEMNSLFPLELPIFYMYSLKKGVSEKPWFT